MALTEREKQILRLNAAGLSDYRIARRLRSYTPTVGRQRRRAVVKLERAVVDLKFARELKVSRNGFLDTLDTLDTNILV